MATGLSGTVNDRKFSPWNLGFPGCSEHVWGVAEDAALEVGFIHDGSGAVAAKSEDNLKGKDKGSSC